MHGADDVSGVPQHDHDQHRDKAGQPEALTHLRRDTLPPPGSVKLRHHRGQRQQKAVAEEDRRQPDGGPDGHGGHIRGAVATRHHGIDKTHRRLRYLRKDDGYSQS